MARLMHEAARTIAAASIVANYSLIGSVFTHPISILYIYNDTDGDLWFSLDGVENGFAMKAGTQEPFYVTSNTKKADPGLFIAASDGVYVKRLDTPTTGSVYVSALYGSN